MDKIITFLWNLWCILSIVGLWPRFIEPKLIFTNKLKLNLPKTKSSSSIKIVLFSDLHMNKNTKRWFLNKLTRKINQLNPDLILFTGDALCHATIYQEEHLTQFFASLKAKNGVYAVLGNHDFASYITKNSEGHYDVQKKIKKHFILRAFKQLYSQNKNKPQVTQAAKNCPPHPKLLQIFKKTGVGLLDNESVTLTINQRSFNLIGLGDYWAGKVDDNKAFQNINSQLFNLVLCHNPDTIDLLSHRQTDLILSGHTHGGQVNLPWFYKTFVGVENKALIRGYCEKQGKKIYITRGVGSHQNFRFFSPPEIVEITL